jgi:hypothetical protein
MARPGRLELPTLCLEGRCSIQLSYGRILDCCPDLTRVAVSIRHPAFPGSSFDATVVGCRGGESIHLSIFQRVFRSKESLRMQLKSASANHSHHVMTVVCINLLHDASYMIFDRKLR